MSGEWRSRLRLLLIALLLLVVLLATILTVRRYFEVSEVLLPDVTGMDFIEATKKLQELDLLPESYPETVAGVDANAVTSQSPLAGAVVRRGRSVSIGVNYPPETARAPLLTGLPLADAVRTLAGMNLVITEVTYASSSTATGRIVSQEPAPGGTLDDGQGLSVVVSRGPQVAVVELPDLNGLPLEEASNRLKSLGFHRIEKLAASVSYDRPGVVSRQSPGAGSAVPVSTPVMLYYALPGDTVVKIPELLGVPLKRARQLLLAAGLEIGDVRQLDDPELPAGVVTVEPAGYTLKGTPVLLEVNGSEPLDTTIDPFASPGEPSFPTGPSDSAGNLSIGSEVGEPLFRTVPFSFDPEMLGVRSLMDSDYQLRLIVVDDRGERTVLDRLVGAGQSVSTTITIYGDAILQTFINDIFFQAWSP